MDQTELLWACLNAGVVEDVKQFNPECIEWGRHNQDGYTVSVGCVNLLLAAKQESFRDRTFDCMKLCISWGANPWQKCSESARDVRLKGGTSITVKTAGLSAISYVETWILRLQDTSAFQEKYEKINVLRRALSCFVTAIPKQKTGRVSVHEGIAELWEKQLAAKSSHDLTFKTADGEVTAHAQMLKDASSVISAMLASTMKEGQTKAIWVKDASSSGVSLFLETLSWSTTLLYIIISLFVFDMFNIFNRSVLVYLHALVIVVVIFHESSFNKEILFVFVVLLPDGGSDIKKS